MVNHDLYNETSNLYAKQWMKLAEMDDCFSLFFCTHSYSVRSTSARAKADRQEFFIRIFLHLNFDCCNADWDFLFWDKNICETHRWLARSFTFVCKNRFIIDAIFFFQSKVSIHFGCHRQYKYCYHARLQNETACYCLASRALRNSRCMNTVYYITQDT